MAFCAGGWAILLPCVFAVLAHANDEYTWLIAPLRKSCTEGCALVGQTCNVEALTTLTADTISSAAAEAGYNCTNFRDWQYPGNPSVCIGSVCQHSVEFCDYGLTGDADCDAVMGTATDHRRLCPCIQVATNWVRLDDRFGYVAVNEGTSVADINDIDLDECGRRCDNNSLCHSFSYCDGSNPDMGKRCHLKDLELHGDEAVRMSGAGDCSTMYQASAPPPTTPPPAPAPTPPQAIIEAALKYLGAKCDTLTAGGCNPYQLPVYDHESFVHQLLLKVDAEDVDPNTDEEKDYSSQVKVSMHASEQSTSDASSFGISASVPYDDVVFSGGVQHQHLTKSMYNSGSAHFYSEVHRTYTVYSASLTKVVAGDELQRAIDDLPYSVESEEDRQKWLVFFSKYGTHYIKSVFFGGTMRRTTFVDVSVKESSEFKESDWSFYLGASFEKIAGLDFSWDDDHTQEKYEQFLKYQGKHKFFSIGGDQSITNYDSWLSTVKAKPAPVVTKLGSIADLLSSKDSAAALKAYFDACPNTDENGVCNGYGRCDPLAGTCTCSDSAYLEDDGKCYPKCLQGSSGIACNGKGKCSYGACKCQVTKDGGFGFKGDACEEKCGAKVYDARTDCGKRCIWCVPGTDCHFLNNYPFSGGEADDLRSASCFCRDVTGIDDDEMHAISTAPSPSFDPPAYDACTDKAVCDWSVLPPVIFCTGLASITCHYGDSGDSCDSDSTMWPVNSFEPLARPISESLSNIV